jgi:hypothetical protein
MLHPLPGFLCLPKMFGSGALKSHPSWTSERPAYTPFDHAREVRERKGADRCKSTIEPRLVADGNLQRCSVCGYPFQADEKPSMSVAFAEPLVKTHQPEPTSEDAS